MITGAIGKSLSTPTAPKRGLPLNMVGLLHDALEKAT